MAHYARIPVYLLKPLDGQGQRDLQIQDILQAYNLSTTADILGKSSVVEVSRIFTINCVSINAFLVSILYRT